MTVSIAEAMQQAQAAMNVGDYRAASSTCSLLVSQFPGYALAHELLGEAYREQGQSDDARDAFASALARHQRHPGVYLGLGLLAEYEGEPEHALAYCQVAWELAPERNQLRDPLVRVAMRRYGTDGDLQLSQAALAQLHASGSRLRRAVEAYRRALADLPDRVDLQLGLAECLWRLGSDDEARRMAQGVMERFPESAPALVILTDIEHRHGQSREADDLLKRLRAVDPDGAIAAGMTAMNPLADSEYLSVHASAMPFLSADYAAAPTERPRIAPAPDFEYRPMRSEVPVMPIEDLEPISVEEFGGTAEDIVPISLEELGILPGDIPGGESFEHHLSAAEASQMDDKDFSIEGLEPITLEDLGATPDEFPADAFSFPSSDVETLSASEAVSFGFEDFSEQPFEPTSDAAAPDFANLFEQGADEVVASEPAGMQDAGNWLSPAPSDGVQTPAADDDALSLLAASLEDDVAQALSRIDDPAAAHEDPSSNVPPDQTPSGYTTMLQSLGDAGLAPFDPRDRAMSTDQTDAMPTLEMDDRLLEDARPSGEPSDLSDLSQIAGDWDSIDDEILRAMPEGPQRGYTDELRALDEIGLEPFTVDDAEGDDALQGMTPFNPFATNSRAGESRMAPAPLDELIPLPDEAQDIELPTSEAVAVEDVDDELPSDLAPFSFDEFDAPTTAQQTGDAPITSWLTGGGGSAVPSDEDLEALLAADDSFSQEPAPVTERELRIVADTSQPTERERRPESDLLKLVPGLTEDEIDPEIDQSLAVTRQLETVDAAEAADTLTHEEPQPFADELVEDVSESPQTTGLRPGTEIFLRARQVKDEMVSEGIITGTRELREGFSTDDLIAIEEDTIPTRELSEESLAAEQATADDLAFEDEDILVGTGATRDTETLRAALEVTPDDDELHWWLAEALRERGDMQDAYSEYRWLIRNAPSRQNDVLHALHECVERDRAPEMAHRLLGDIYRRRGDVTRASNHAALALQARRRAMSRR
jgi:tetratricopeptide (TPR) repeat protein